MKAFPPSQFSRRAQTSAAVTPTDNSILMVKKHNLKIEISNKQERARLAGPEISLTCLFYSSRVTDICLQEILVSCSRGQTSRFWNVWTPCLLRLVIGWARYRWRSKYQHKHAPDGECIVLPSRRTFCILFVEGWKSSKWYLFAVLYYFFVNTSRSVEV